MTETHQTSGVTESMMDHGTQSCPWAFYRQLHEHAPVYRVPENGAYIVSTYELLRDTLNDPERFSNRSFSAAGLQADRVKRQQEILAERGWQHVAVLQRTDPPVHNRYRKLLNRVFTARKVASMAAHIDEVTNTIIDSFIDRGECEFVSEFTLPLPGIIIAEELGLPPAEIHRFARWADAMLAPSMRLLSEAEVDRGGRDRARGPAPPRRGVRGPPRQPARRPDLRPRPRPRCRRRRAAHRARAPEPHAPARHGRLRDDHQRARSRHVAAAAPPRPDGAAALRPADPHEGLHRGGAAHREPGAGPGPPDDLPGRGAGVGIPEGSLVYTRYGAANRDESQFPDADRFDITRPNSASHLAFGGGPHYCIGAALARQEMHSAFTNLLRRLDDIQLASPVPEPAHHPSIFLMPLKELRLTFTKKA